MKKPNDKLLNDLLWKDYWANIAPHKGKHDYSEMPPQFQPAHEHDSCLWCNGPIKPLSGEYFCTQAHEDNMAYWLLTREEDHEV